MSKKFAGQDLLDGLVARWGAMRALGFRRVPDLRVIRGDKIKTSVRPVKSMIVIILIGGESYMRTVTDDDIDELLSE